MKQKNKTPKSAPAAASGFVGKEVEVFHPVQQKWIRGWAEKDAGPDKIEVNMGGNLGRGYFQKKNVREPASPTPSPAHKSVPRREIVEDSGLTRLQVGDIVDLGTGLGGEHIVWKCNDCRATCIPLTRKAVEFTRHGSGEAVRYAAHLKPIGISPNSEVSILRRLGKTGMIEFLETQNKTTESESSMANKNKNKATTEDSEDSKPKLGRLGGFHGFAITAVIRAMAVAGWEYWECRAVFDAEKIDVADNTIRIQLSAGRKGKGGDPADLSAKFLKSIRPDPADKPETSRAAAKPAKKAKKAAAVEAKPAKKAKAAVVEDDEEADEEADEEPAPKPAKKKATPVPAADEDEEAEDADGDQ